MRNFTWLSTSFFKEPKAALASSKELILFANKRLEANEILLFGHRLTAHEAHSSGLVTHVVPHSEFPLECDKLLKEMVQLPPQSLLYSKELMRVRDRERLHAVNNLECDRLMERWTGPECVQAVTNFFQRDKR
ncbi:unnamed protein product [Dicrocoelium dendriticum]|nr:unnamed protein product [Dicrocoelium dendriticum]